MPSQTRVQPVVREDGTPLRYLLLVDSQGEEFFFTDHGGEWHTFIALVDPTPLPSDEALEAHIGFDLEDEDPDLELIAFLIARQFQESVDQGREFTDDEIDKEATKIAKLTKRSAPENQNGGAFSRRRRQDGGANEDTTDEGIFDGSVSTGEAAAIFGVIVLVGSLGYALLRKPKGRK